MNDARILRWICNFIFQNKTSAAQLRTTLKLQSMRECLQDRRLQQFRYRKNDQRLLGLVNVKSSRIAVASAKVDQEKHGIK